MTWITDNVGISTDMQGKILASFIVLVVLFSARFLMLRSVHQRVDDGEAAYRTTKLTTYSVTIIGILTLSWIWLDAFDNVATYLGLVSAGIAIALSDVLKNMAGWIYLLTRRPFKVGDRIEISGLKGDVIDIRLFRFSLMEVGNWVDADQSTGRLVHVPNGNVFTTPIANYTEGFQFVWHELPFLVTFESNWRTAEEILQKALREHAPKLDSKHENQIRTTARRYQIKIGAITPIVYLTVKDSGILLTGRFLVDARARRSTEEFLWKAILDAIADDPTVELAYPTVRTFFEGSLPIRQEPTAPGA
ncbi:MAG: mechanosensitive ion channel family protein [Acidimicrobiia bacterium]|nr:mechanosensitive ion channel family protein [Acidimicrobiia bacterium]